MERDKEKEALIKSGKENFSQGFVDLNLFLGMNPSNTNKVKKLGENLSSALVELFKLKSKYKQSGK